MKYETYSALSDVIATSISSIRSKQIKLGSDNSDATHFVIGVLKSLLTEAMLDLTEYQQEQILKTLGRI